MNKLINQLRGDNGKYIFPEWLLGAKYFIELGDGKEGGEKIESDVKVFELFVFHNGPELDEDK